MLVGPERHTPLAPGSRVAEPVGRDGMTELMQRNTEDDDDQSDEKGFRVEIDETSAFSFCKPVSGLDAGERSNALVAYQIVERFAFDDEIGLPVCNEDDGRAEETIVVARHRLIVRACRLHGENIAGTSAPGYCVSQRRISVSQCLPAMVTVLSAGRLARFASRQV